MIKSQRKIILKSSQTKEKSCIQGNPRWISQQKLSKSGKKKRTYTNIESKKQTNKQNQSIENSTPGRVILQK